MARKDLSENAPADGGIDKTQEVSTPNDNTLAADQQNSDSLLSAVDSHSKGYEGFDAALHAVNSDGSPKLRADGSFALKRGRKKGGASPLPAPGDSGAAIATKAAVPSEDQKIRIDMAARTSANLIFNAGVFAFGDEWKPEKEEAAGMLQSFKDYYAIRGVPNVPPEIGLLAAVAMYAMPRIGMPQTQARIALIRAKLTGRAQAEQVAQ